MQLSFRVKKQWRFLGKAGMHAATSHVGNKNVYLQKVPGQNIQLSFKITKLGRFLI